MCRGCAGLHTGCSWITGIQQRKARFLVPYICSLIPQKSTWSDIQISENLTLFPMCWHRAVKITCSTVCVLDNLLLPHARFSTQAHHSSLLLPWRPELRSTSIFITNARVPRFNRQMPSPCPHMMLNRALARPRSNIWYSLPIHVDPESDCWLTVQNKARSEKRDGWKTDRLDK